MRVLTLFVAILLLLTLVVLSSSISAANSSVTTPAPKTATTSSGGNPTCTADMISYDFGLCDPSTNKMRAMPYYTQTCDSMSGLVSTEHPPKLVDCQAGCDAGHFMSPKTDQCEKCPAGRFSTGDSLSFPSYESKGSVMWSSRCSPDPCEKWQMLEFAGGSVTFHSGNQSIGKRSSSPYSSYQDPSATEDESVISVLSVMVDIKDPEGGSVRFQYRTESEKYFDGLVIFVNGTVHLNDNSYFSGGGTLNGKDGKAWSITEQNAPFFMTGTWDTYQAGVIFLPFGTTEIRYIYRKDSNQAVLSDEYGLDRAFITNFIVEGARVGSTYCSPCPTGTYSEEGSASCTVCPINTYSDKSGSANCQKCAEGSYSLAGSASCTKYPECTDDDYVASYVGNCDKATGKQTLTWKLPPDARCHETTAPADKQVDCLACPFGGYRDANMQCQFCQPGYAESPDGKSACVPCPAGTYGEPSARFEHGFESLADGATEFLNKKVFTSECEGECADCLSPGSCTNAFVLTSLQHSDADRTFVAIRSNTLNGDDYHSHLVYVFNTTSDQGATVRISYFFAYQDVSPPTELAVLDPDLRAYAFTYDAGSWGDSIPFPMTPTGRAGEREITLKTAAKKGEFTFELHLHKNAITRAAHRRLTLYITKFSVDGDSRGSAPKCISCPKGHYCPGKSIAPMPCEVGTHADITGAASCERCTGNTVATMTGEKVCDECYAGSVPNADHTWCDQECRVDIPGRGTFDFSVAKTQVFGPAPSWTAYSSMEQLDSWDVTRYYFSLCDHVQPKYCPQRNGEHLQSSLLCQRFNSNMSFSIGDEREFIFSEDGKLTLSVNHGDLCPRFANRPRTSNITMVCDPSTPVDPTKPDSFGTFEFLGEGPTCHYKFHLTSALACPLCKKEDFTQFKGECSVEGLRTVTYAKKNDALCYAGPVGGSKSVADLPKDTVERCVHCNVNDFEIFWADCDESTNLQKRFITLKSTAGDCYDNGTTRDLFAATVAEPETRACQKSVSSRALPYTVIIAVIIAVSLLCVLIKLQKKHAALRQQYETLHTEAYGSSEMGAKNKNGKNTGAQDDDEVDGRDELEANNQVLDVIDDEAANDVHPAVRHPSPGLIVNNNNHSAAATRTAASTNKINIAESDDF